MARAPQINVLKESDLNIPEGPITSQSLRDVFTRLFSQLNPFLEGLNTLNAKGLSRTDNLTSDIVTGTFAHGVPQLFGLSNLLRANGGAVLSCKTAVVVGHPAVQMVASPSAGKPLCQVTLFFNDTTATSEATLELMEEGEQSSATPTFTAPITAATGTALGRIPTGGGIAWRNNAGSGDLVVAHNASDELTHPVGINVPVAKAVTVTATGAVSGDSLTASAAVSGDTVAASTSTTSPVFSSTGSPASSGQVRLDNSHTIAWRGSGGDVPVGINGSDQLTLNGTALLRQITGRVQLSGGIKTVVHSACSAGSNVQVTRTTIVSGNVGELYVLPWNGGFDIHSSTGTDDDWVHYLLIP